MFPQIEKITDGIWRCYHFFVVFHCMEDYAQYLNDLATRHPEVNELLKEFPRLADIMKTDDNVCVALKMYKPGAANIVMSYLKDTRAKIADNIKRMESDDLLERLEKSDASPEELTERVFGEGRYKEQENIDLEKMTNFFAINLLNSTMPGELYKREIKAVKTLLGHEPGADWDALSISEWIEIMKQPVEIIAMADQLLVNGEEDKLKQWAVVNDVFDVVDVIAVTRALQRYLMYLEYQKYEWDNKQLADLHKAPPVPAPADIIIIPQKTKEELWKKNSAKLFSSLTANGFIDGSAEDFQNIFSGRLPQKKINWRGKGNQINLIYFLHHLFLVSKLVQEPKNRNAAIASYFSLEGKSIDSKNNSITKSYSAIRSDDHVPASAKKIDHIISEAFSE
jgi:hypothetical protein